FTEPTALEIQEAEMQGVEAEHTSELYYRAGKAHIYEVGLMLTLLRFEHWGFDLTGRYEAMALPRFPVTGGREATFMGRATAGLQLSKTLVRSGSSGWLMDYFLMPAEV